MSANQWTNPCPFCGRGRVIVTMDFAVAKTCPVCGKNLPRRHPMDTHGWTENPSPGTKKPPR